MHATKVHGLVLAALLCAGGCSGSDQPARSAREPTARVHRSHPALARCPLPQRKNPARWFYDVALRMKRARDDIAREAHGAQRRKEWLAFACLNAKARVATQVMHLVAAEHDALRAQTPPDPLVTRRILAYCRQVRQLAEEARRCASPPPSSARP